VVADPADDCELANALEKLLDPARRQQMGEAARRLALRYTLDRNCDELMAVYREVAQRQRCAA
jgi:glycosyltransferase involved in cell wall biosynthesis